MDGYQTLAPAGRVGGGSRREPWDVGPDDGCDLDEPFHLDAVQPPEGAQERGGVGTAAAHPAGDGDPLVEHDIDPRGRACGVGERLGGTAQQRLAARLRELDDPRSDDLDRERV